MNLSVTGEVLKVFDLQVIGTENGSNENLYFRVEIIKNLKKTQTISARVWRMEFYRLQPTFPQTEGTPQHEPCDELIFVEEASLVDRRSGVRTKSYRKVLENVMA